jgi:hypothetical protein
MTEMTEDLITAYNHLTNAQKRFILGMMQAWKADPNMGPLSLMEMARSFYQPTSKEKIYYRAYHDTEFLHKSELEVLDQIGIMASAFERLASNRAKEKPNENLG